MIMAHLLLFLTLKWWEKYQLLSQLSEKPSHKWTEVIVELEFHAQNLAAQKGRVKLNVLLQWLQ